MTEDMDRLIEAINRLADAFESDKDFHQKVDTELLGHGRFMVGTNFVNSWTVGLVETLAKMKIYQEFVKELSERILPLVVQGEWEKALECYIAGTKEFVEQHKGKKKDVNKTAYS